MKSTYIYALFNINDNPNTLYIGKTINIKSRKRDHKTLFGKNIEFNIIDEVKSIYKEDWKPLECYWMEQFQQWGFTLLNKNKGGGGPQYRDKKSLQIIIQKLKTPIQQYNQKLELVREWSSIKEAKEELGGDIDGCLNGKIKKSKGFYFKYPHQDISIFNLSPKIGKKVLQYDIDGNLLNMYNSTQEAELIFNALGKDNIGACCRGKQKTSYGYVWKYKY